MVNITNVGSPQTIFTASQNETILEAAIRSNIRLPYGCKNGGCGVCKCKLMRGTVNLGDYNRGVLTDYEIRQGYTLPCKAYPMTDLILEVLQDLKTSNKAVSLRVKSIIKSAHVAIIQLDLPSNLQFSFHAGQYVNVTWQGNTRSYSLSNTPKQRDILEIHVKHRNNGRFSNLVWHELKCGDILKIDGPHGIFQLHRGNNPIILLATGTGFAPIKALIDEMYAKQDKRLLHLYWGNRDLEDFYLLDKLVEWQSQLNLRISLCITNHSLVGSEEYMCYLAANQINYFFGRITQLLQNDYALLTNYDVYACGNANMIQNVLDISTHKLNLSKNSFYADTFATSG